MQTQVTRINPEANRTVSNEVQKLTPHLGLRFHNHSNDRLKEIYDAGELSPKEVREEIFKAPRYYEQTATHEWIKTAYRFMVAARPLASRPTGELAFVINQFANDLVSEGLSPAEIDYAFEVWRKSDEKFAPHQGDVLSILKAAGFARPSAGRGERYVERLRALIDPEFNPKPRQSFVGARTAPKPPTEKLSTEERLAVIERVNSRIGKLGGELKPKTFGKTDADKQRRKDLLLASRKERLEIIVIRPPMGVEFFSVVGFSTSKPIKIVNSMNRDEIRLARTANQGTPIATFSKRADADAFVEEART